MQNGIQNLGDFNITIAGTQSGDWVENFDGVQALTTQFRFSYGSGGTSVRAYLQTSLDQGATPIDISCAVFGTASSVNVVNLSGLTPMMSIWGDGFPADGALADSTIIDGILGDRFRIKLVSTGVYAASTVLSVRAHPR